MASSDDVGGSPADGGSDVDLGDLKSKLVSDLSVLLAEHHQDLQRRLGDWAAAHDEGGPPPASYRSGRSSGSWLDLDTVGPAQGMCSEASLGDRSECSVGTDFTRRLGGSGVGRSPAGGSSRNLARSHSGFLATERKQSMLFSFLAEANSYPRSAPGEPAAHTTYARAVCLQHSVRGLVQSPAFDNFISAAILLYVVAMGIEVDIDPGYRQSVVNFQMGCNFIFIAELLLRLVALGREFCLGRDMYWNLLDFSLVFMSVFEMAINAMGSSIKVFDSVLMLRIVRIVRVVRVIRVVRLFRFFRHLRLIVQSIFATLKSLPWFVVLLLIVIYSFGIVFAQASGSDPESLPLTTHFGSLFRSILTLFKCVTNGMAWEDAFRPLQDVHWAYGLSFILYMIFNVFVVLNVMTAQFCQAAIESARKDEDEVIRHQLANTQFYVEKLQSLFSTITGSSGDSLTLDTFDQCLDDERVEAYFHALDIKIWDAWSLFRLLDVDNNHRIHIDKFVDGCLQLKGPATAISINKLSSEIRWLDHRLQEMAEGQDSIQEGLSGLKAEKTPPVARRRSRRAATPETTRTQIV